MTADPYPNLAQTELRRNGESRQLVLLVHGAWATPTELLLVRDAVEWILPDADVLMPHYRSGLFARVPAIHIVREFKALMREALADRAERGGSYESSIIIGYSIGACLALRLAMDRLMRSPRIARLVLLSGTNWGWSLWPTPPGMAWWLRDITRATMRTIAALGIAQTVRSLQYGRGFGTHLQKHWREALADPARADRIPWIVLLQGANDEFIGPRTTEGLVGHPRVRVFTVPDTQHLTILLMDETPIGRERQLALKMALTADLDQETYPHPAGPG